jgi:glycosyltransferase involved in cell wall biosynthesis
MAAGCPLVATDRGDVARVLGRAGVVLPDADPLRFAQTAAQLLDCPDVLRAMTAAGPARVAERFTTDRVVQDLLCCYEALGIAPR